MKISEGQVSQDPISKGPRSAGLLLAPGAGAGSDQPALVAIDRELSDAGIVVERMDFPYRLAGRRAPDRPPVLLAALEDNARRLAGRIGVTQSRVALGGRSMGGRIAVDGRGRPDYQRRDWFSSELPPPPAGTPREEPDRTSR